MMGTIGGLSIGQLGTALMSREESRPAMHFRACIAAVAAALLLLLGPAAAQASHGFSVSKTEAAAGEEVEFQIAGTQAGESYIIKVEDQEVASGVDNAGNGVTDKFKMPDFGSTSRAVSVEVDITPLGGDAEPHRSVADAVPGCGQRLTRSPRSSARTCQDDRRSGAGARAADRHATRREGRQTLQGQGHLQEQGQQARKNRQPDF